MTSINNLFASEQPYGLGNANAPNGWFIAINQTLTGLEPVENVSLGVPTGVQATMSLQAGTPRPCEVFFIQTGNTCSVFLNLYGGIGLTLNGAQTPGVNQLGEFNIIFDESVTGDIPPPDGGSANLNTVPGCIQNPTLGQPDIIYMLSMHIDFDDEGLNTYSITGIISLNATGTNPTPVPANAPFSFGTCNHNDSPYMVYLGDYIVSV